jgi:hypothetical protein
VTSSGTCPEVHGLWSVPLPASAGDTDMSLDSIVRMRHCASSARWCRSCPPVRPGPSIRDRHDARKPALARSWRPWPSSWGRACSGRRRRPPGPRAARASNQFGHYDGTERQAKHASVPFRHVRALKLRCKKFLYELKAGPAGGRLRRPSSRRQHRVTYRGRCFIVRGAT